MLEKSYKDKTDLFANLNLFEKISYTLIRNQKALEIIDRNIQSIRRQIKTL